MVKLNKKEYENGQWMHVSSRARLSRGERECCIKTLRLGNYGICTLRSSLRSQFLCEL